ncbi:hypothetical protein [Trichloromonas acetexigens]|uniref:Uncharacterized protein n=1 Tax=Trichloromonas acetexigens TaxID=38815 RepID=A0A550JEV0_9BACT|nr:hypothetical protein [Desulfuromonas acetexigens]TRO81726.1 hypothetical protein FL622_07925 [Desulfuromonas acetexigens]
MSTNPIKLLLAANIFFLIISIACLSNAYFGSYNSLSLSADKTSKFEEIIKNETNIEKLRSIAKFSYTAQNGAYKTVDLAIEATSKAITLFSIMFCFNTLYLLTYLFKNKKKSNNIINRTENTSVQN